MKFGVFDHVDASGPDLGRHLENRLKIVEAYDRCGIHAYHVAEHHATPRNLVPVPGVFLGAVAQATSKIKLGPLVYLLPLYSPLRLIETQTRLEDGVVTTYGDIAFALGFYDQSSFTVQFKKTMSMTPLQYRNQFL